MSILFSGDLDAHKRGQPESIRKKTLLAKYRDKYDGIKYHIILGDGGFLWPDFGNEHPSENEEKCLKVLAERDFPTLCVIGDRDLILDMDDVREEDIGIGEKVLVAHENPFVAYLKRGKIYAIDGFKFLVLGGALHSEYFVPIRESKTITDFYSVKSQCWKEEEKQDLFKLLGTENSFDFVLSHTGPQRVNKLLFGARQGKRDPAEKFNDEVAFMNDKVDETIQCHGWWCGHWHENKFHFDEAAGKGYQYLHGRTNLLERTDTGIKVYDGLGNENPNEMNLAIKRREK